MKAESMTREMLTDERITGLFCWGCCKIVMVTTNMRRREEFDKVTHVIYVVVHRMVSYRLLLVCSTKYRYVFSDEKGILNYEIFRRDYQKPFVKNKKRVSLVSYPYRVERRDAAGSTRLVSTFLASVRNEKSYIARAEMAQPFKASDFVFVACGYFERDIFDVALSKLFDDGDINALFRRFYGSFR